MQCVVSHFYIMWAVGGSEIRDAAFACEKDDEMKMKLGGGSKTYGARISIIPHSAETLLYWLPRCFTSKNKKQDWCF